eukprot:TRINITY_DN34137_c0_g1_i1.p1 TRINITY_DN34137_c0_g1~~TRINITY_DN34137_c0_g1_i1.p1  ORF type:complete len:599 (+),score=19.74 TRINITY_DN34137_c0_g1_i1:42-1838(+)
MKRGLESPDPVARRLFGGKTKIPRMMPSPSRNKSVAQKSAQILPGAKPTAPQRTQTSKPKPAAQPQRRPLSTTTRTNTRTQPGTKKASNTRVQAQPPPVAVVQTGISMEDYQTLLTRCTNAETKLAQQAAQYQAMQQTSQTLQNTCVELQQHLAVANESKQQLAGQLSVAHEGFSTMKVELTATKQTLDMEKSTSDGLRTQVHELKDKVARQAEIEVLAVQERKRLHNAIQELKGNIRVFARVRGPDQAVNHLEFPDKLDSRQLSIAQTSASVSGVESVKKHPFSFDKVFGPAAAQDEVFSEISQLVQSALDGYRVCVFAYGQTGSGKTFTMEGECQQGDTSNPRRGVIPRAVDQIFEEAERVKELGWEYTLECQFVEIYNEELRDLLADPATYNKGMQSPRGVGKTAPRHEIKIEGDMATVTNITIETVTRSGTVASLLAKASKARATASTQHNDRSSRSHSIFTLRIRGTNEATGQKSEGCLNLIDLAGSERLSSELGRTEEQKKREKEATCINSSLSCLKDVIVALAGKKAHVPYRNSKLTWLLSPCLGGDCKTLMFVNISPDSDKEHVSESLNSLRFATTVNSCEIGTARRKVR